MNRYRILFVLPCLGAAACNLGPQSVGRSHIAYNRSIRGSNDEQLLLNLVRVRYSITRQWLRQNQVSTQFVFEGESSLTGQSVRLADLSPVPGWIGLASLRRSEIPTATFVPNLDDQEILRLYSPVRVDTLALLLYAGWEIDRVLRLLVEQINGVDNQSMFFAVSREGRLPDYVLVERATRALRSLAESLLLEIAYVDRQDAITSGVPASAFEGAAQAMVDAEKEGLRWVLDEGSKTYSLVRTTPTAAFVFAPEAAGTDEFREAFEILRLDPSCREFPLQSATGGQINRAHDDRPYTELLLSVRSLDKLIFLLSSTVCVPPEDIARGLAAPDEDWPLNTFGDLLRIHSSNKRPKCAAVATKFHGHWFWIDDADVESKETFKLLAELLALEITTHGETAVPVLTLPVAR